MMTTFIALLRGINVGGKNKVDMKQLKLAFTEAGFADVRTYINSGNVIFISNKAAADVKKDCEAVILESFGINIAVAVITADELTDALNHAPEWWGKSADEKHNAIFVIAPATAKEVCDEVGEIKPEHERCAHYGSVIFWSAPKETFSHTRWSAISKRTTYQKITIRNSNTAYRLLELVKQ